MARTKNQNPKTETHVVVSKIPVETYTLLANMADTNRRSVAKTVQYIIEQHVASAYGQANTRDIRNMAGITLADATTDNPVAASGVLFNYRT